MALFIWNNYCFSCFIEEIFTLETIMHLFFIIYGAILLISFLTMTFLLIKSPLGWEDEHGFHTKSNKLKN